MESLLFEGIDAFLEDFRNSDLVAKMQKGELILKHLLPQETRDKLKERGVHCIVDCNCSRKREIGTLFVFSFVKASQMRQVSFSVSDPPYLYTVSSWHKKEKATPLLSLSQIQREIKEAMSTFLL